MKCLLLGVYFEVIQVWILRVILMCIYFHGKFFFKKLLRHFSFYFAFCLFSFPCQKLQFLLIFSSCWIVNLLHILQYNLNSWTKITQLLLKKLLLLPVYLAIVFSYTLKPPRPQHIEGHRTKVVVINHPKYQFQKRY